MHDIQINFSSLYIFILYRFCYTLLHNYIGKHFVNKNVIFHMKILTFCEKIISIREKAVYYKRVSLDPSFYWGYKSF
jgi:hypothetical protein